MELIPIRLIGSLPIAGMIFLLGMPWHVSHNPSTDYEQRVVKVGTDVIPAFQKNEDNVQVMNLGLKKFRRMFKNNMKKVELFQVKIREVKHSKE